MSYCLSSPWPGFNYRPWRSILGDFSLADHTLPTRHEPASQKMAQSPLNGPTQPMDIKFYFPNTERQWLKRHYHQDIEKSDPGIHTD